MRLYPMNKKRKHVFFSIFICTFLFAATLYNGLVIKKYTVKTDMITNTIRVVLISDLHSVYYGERQNKLIAEINRQLPDIIMLTGDIADDVKPHDGTIDFLEGVAHKYPCYYISGNHEFWSGEVDNIKAMFRSYNVKVLEGENEILALNGDTINICGVDDPEVGEEIFRQQINNAMKVDDSENYTILLAHRPERIEQYMKYDCDLILSGHNHGGQWRIPIVLNGFIAPNEGFFPKYGGGRYDVDNTVMIVSRGLKKNIGKYPRIFNPPELVVIDIVPE